MLLDLTQIAGLPEGGNERPVVVKDSLAFGISNAVHASIVAGCLTGVKILFSCSNIVYARDAVKTLPRDAKTTRPREAEGGANQAGRDYQVPAVAAALKLLLHLREMSERQSTLSEISRGVGMSKSTVFGLLRTLEMAGFVEMDPLTKRYGLGSTLIGLGEAASARLDAVQVGRRHLHQAVVASGLTGILAKPLPDRFVVLYKEESQSEIRATMSVGQEVPHAGAIGKILLAYMDASERSERLSELEMADLIPSRPASEREAEYERIRADGYSVSQGEYRRGVNAVAAPIFDHTGRICLVACLIGMAGSLSSGALLEAGRKLGLVADRASQELGAPRLASQAV